MAAEPWLLRLYPAAWRARYGEEFAELLVARPPALRDRLDVIAGAVDARLHPQLTADPAEVAGRARDRSVAALLVVAGGLLTIWATIGVSFAGMWDGPEEATARTLMGVSYASGVAGAVLIAIALLVVASRYDWSIGGIGAVAGVLTGSGLVFSSFGGGVAALLLLVGGTLMLAWRLRGRLVGTVPAVGLAVTTMLAVGAFVAVAASGWSDTGPFWLLVLYGPAWMLVGADLRAPVRQLAVA